MAFAFAVFFISASSARTRSVVHNAITKATTIRWAVMKNLTSGVSALQQPVVHERLLHLRFARSVQRAHRQAHLAVAAPEQLHRRLQRDRVCRDAEHVPA